ncbi:hypothetical protein SmJEL517_g01365 [Synchytrium microbalum]|uniref:Rieske domain-containing protein n=1 Tax=Synchytrium microbalum TaxID=1806994 RepID=A0A507CFG0_9FUNG|nr:uncharacterized protein SmJEL517_g01365 [Synchytrium microbalum]TPX36664.1 hypothetical protein SmJEL517_g01365 [Synchytrium microbalum]
MAIIEERVCKVNELKNGQMKEVMVGSAGKALLSCVDGVFRATSHLCPHYKAPLAKGALSEDGRVICPWHGACFSVNTGDIEDGPSLDSLQCFEVIVKGSDVYIRADEDAIKLGRRVPPSVRISSTDKRTVVILGGGAGGMVCAETLRASGFAGRVVLVSREPYLPIDRPKLSKALKSEPAKIALRDEKFFASQDIDILLGTEAKSVDVKAKKVTLSNKSVLGYDYLVLATGGDPRTLPVPGKDLKNVFVLRTATDSNAIEKAVADAAAAAGGGDAKPNLVIVGSSFIGMEAASILAKQANIAVIGMEKVPFERVLGTRVGTAMATLNTNNGIKLKMEAVVDRFEPSASDKTKIGAVVLKTKEVVAADVIVIGAGVIPKTDFLKDSGIKLDRDGGITVDAQLRVPDAEGVFAVGDVARYPYHVTGEMVRVEHWNVAQNHGRLVARNIVSLTKGLEPKLNFVQIPFFWTVQFGKSIRYAGHAESFDDGSTELDSTGGGLAFMAYYVRGENVLAVAGLGKDPLVSYCSELLRLGKMPSASELKTGKSPSEVALADPSKPVKAASSASASAPQKPQASTGAASSSSSSASSSSVPSSNPALLVVAVIVVVAAVSIYFYNAKKN